MGRSGLGGGRQSIVATLAWATAAGLLLLAGGTAIALAQPLTPRPLPASTRILDIDGRQIGRMGPVNRENVAPDEIPGFLKRAVIDTEDRDFYRNPGIDGRAIARAALTDLRARRFVQGGSTITQQLARNLYLSPRRTLLRKAVEAIDALRLTRTLTKDEILALYLNDAYFGEGAYGVEAAARTYFGRGVRELAPPDLALLAGLLRAPSADDPRLNPGAALLRRREVLSRMVAAGDLTPGAAHAVGGAPLALAPRRAAGSYALDAARHELKTTAPEAYQAILSGVPHTVRLTLSSALQDEAEAAVRTAVSGLPPHTEAALVAVDPRDGAIRALVGGSHYVPGAFDAALDGARPVASTFKPVIWAEALRRGWSLSSRLPNAPVTFRGEGQTDYRPQDGIPSVAPTLSLREALARSDNWAALRLMHWLGPNAVRTLARDLGWRGELPSDLTVALGSASAPPVVLARIYSAFANGGAAVTPHLIQAIDRRVVAHARRPVLSPVTAYLVTDALQSVATAGTARGSGLPAGVGAKTGTGESGRDGWLVAVSPRLVVAGWVGGPSPLAGDGAHTAGVMVSGFLRKAGTLGTFAPPPGITHLVVSERTGLLPNGVDPVTTEVFAAGREPRAVSPLPVPARVDPAHTEPPDLGDDGEERSSPVEEIWRELFGRRFGEKRGAGVRT